MKVMRHLVNLRMASYKMLKILLQQQYMLCRWFGPE